MKQDIKTKVAPKHTLLSLIILGVLAVVAGGVYMAQFNYYPAVEQLASTLPAADQGEPTPTGDAGPSLISLPAGQTPMTPMEAFDAATLSDKINGKAELYLASGFKRLHSQRLQMETADEIWMEVFVYDMQTPQNAFAVFSAQRRSDARKVDLGQYGYQTANALFFVHGPFYVEIVASDTSETIIAPMRTLAKTFIKAHPVKTQTIDEKALFPAQGLMADSITLVSADAFGYERFDQIFTATYHFEGSELMAYVSRRQSPAEAQELMSGYADFLMAFGGLAVEPDLPVPAARMVHILDTYEVVFSQGPYLIGVREATDQKSAQKLALQMFDRIKEDARE